MYGMIWHSGGVISYAVPRAVAGVFLGIFLKDVYFTVNKKELFQRKNVKLFIFVVSILLLIVSLMMAVCLSHTEYDYLHIMIFSMLIFSFSLGKQFRTSNKFFIFFDKLILPVYVWQVVALRISPIFGQHSFFTLFLVILLDLLISIVWLLIGKHHAVRTLNK